MKNEKLVRFPSGKVFRLHYLLRDGERKLRGQEISSQEMCGDTMLELSTDWMDMTVNNLEPEIEQGIPEVTEEGV